MLCLVVYEGRVYCANVGENSAVLVKQTQFDFLEPIQLAERHTLENVREKVRVVRGN